MILLPGQHWRGILSRLFGHSAIMIDGSSKTLGMEMSIWACIRNGDFVHFALWFRFLIWETDVIKQVRFVIYLSRALMSYSCFIWASNRSSGWENGFGTSIKVPHCSFSALMFELTNYFAIWRCKHHILLNTHVTEKVLTYLSEQCFYSKQIHLEPHHRHWGEYILNFHIWKV